MENVLPEGVIVLTIPDIEDILFAQLSEHPGFDMLFPTADIAPVAMPQEIARMDLAIP